MKYSTEFFVSIDEKRDDYLDFAEDYEPLKAFFAGEQVTIFDRAIRLMDIYDDSKTFIVDAQIEQFVLEIKTVMKKSAPYSEIFKLPDLLDKFSKTYVDLLEEMAKPVLAAIEEAKNRVFSELEGKQCHDILRSKFVERFLEIKKKAESCNNVATLQNIKEEADALKVRLLNEITAEENKILVTKAKEDEQNSPHDDGEATPPVRPAPKIKKQKTFIINSLRLETTWQIESEADIERYIADLKTRLKQSLEDGTVINIEF